MSKSKKPSLRYKQFTEEWEQRKVQWFVDESIIEPPMDGNHGEKHPKVSDYESKGIPFIMAKDIKNNVVDVVNCAFISEDRAEKLDKGFVKNGDILITHKATIGEVGILNNLVTKYAVLTPQVTYYRILNFSKLSRNFLSNVFCSQNFQREMKEVAAQSTRSYIGITEQQKLNIRFPKDITEQEKIGFFFKQLDNIIALQQRKSNKLKQIKKSLMSQMFPRDGVDTPELRIGEYSDNWELYKLGDLVDIVGGGTPSTNNEEYWNGNIDWYSPIEIGKSIYVSESVNRITDTGLQNSSARILPKGTVLFTSRASIGKTAILAKEGTTNQGFQSIVPKKGKLDSYFIYSRTNELKLYGEANGAGSTFIEVSGKQMAEMPILVPSIEEQIEIGNFFKQLDQTIAIHQEKYEKLKQIKTALLNDMFV